MSEFHDEPELMITERAYEHTKSIIREWETRRILAKVGEILKNPKLASEFYVSYEMPNITSCLAMIAYLHIERFGKKDGRK